jgi:hypothetical protein
MSKNPVSVTWRVVNSVWKAVHMLEDRPKSVSKAKLNGRRGYGDDGIASPDRATDDK